MPQAVASYLITALFSVGVYSTVAVYAAIALSYAAVIGASMAISKLLSPKMPSFSDASLTERSQMVRSPISARQIIYGRCKTAGTIVYISTTGTKNEYLHLVVALAGHEIQEIGDVYFNDEVVLTGSGDGGATGKYTGKATFYKHLGANPQTADAALITATSGLTDGKWTSAHRLDGVAYIYAQLIWDAEVYVGGIPNISCIVKGKKVYDPRTAGTAYSANPALCLRDYITDTALGMGMTSAEIDDTSVTSAANVCEEQVQILPASPVIYENRYDADGVLVTSAAPDENIGKLLSAMGGLIAYSGGKIVMYAAAYRTPTVTLTEKHLAGPISVTTRISARDRVNAVKGVYVSEDNNWTVSDFPAIVSATYLAADNNVRYWRDVVLPFTVSASCAQRLAVIELRRAREEIMFTARFRLESMQVRAGDTVMITNAKFGWTAKAFEVVEWHFVSDGTPPQLAIEMTLHETDSTIYSWTVADEIAVAGAPNTTLPNPYTLSAPTNLTLTADSTTQFLQPDGTIIPRIKVAWTAPAEQFIQSGGAVVLEYRLKTSTTYLTWSRVEGDQTSDYISSDIKSGAGYDVRIFGESYFGTSTTYLSASITVPVGSTAPASVTGGTISGDGVKPKYFPGTTSFIFGTRVGWIPNTESDLSYYEVKATFTNSDAATDYSWSPYDGINSFVTTKDCECWLYNAVLQAGYVRIRAVNRSGVASSWASLGNANSSASIGAGTIAAQSKADVTISGVKTGDTAASSVRQVLARYQLTSTITLAGGSAFEDFNIDLSNRGFGTKPDVGVVVIEGSIFYTATYVENSGSSTSTNAVIRVFRYDGTNTAAASHIIMCEFIEYN